MALKYFYTMIQTQFDTSIKRLKLDNFKEYFTNALNYFFQTEGIIHESLCIYTPQHTFRITKFSFRIDSRDIIVRPFICKPTFGLCHADSINKMPLSQR